MSAVLRTPAALAQARLIPADRVQALERVADAYAVAITPAMSELIDVTCEHDPIGRQFLPDLAELDIDPKEHADPIGDAAKTPVEGIVHRYPDRVLLKPTHTCAVYCRFCFRREVVGPDGAGTLSPAELDAALDYIAGRPEIWEVIVTGGDPLVLSPRRLRDLTARLGGIDHVKVIRFHTRIPVVDPAAVTPELVEALKTPGKATYVALHANHPRELTPTARQACATMVDAGIPMVSQSVLLRGINDDAAVLTDLFRAFVETRIKPYYLHLPDFALGTAHLRTGIAQGRALMTALRGDLSGLAQPTLVLDIPGGHGKVPAGPDYVGDGVVIDPWGEAHGYP
jgi:lysine 2,3-aminomutase